jgi:Carboxypeptidase regulatory-like domain
MKKNRKLLNSLRIASPCSVGWEKMSGDEKARLCQLCNLKVYNIVQMTDHEVEALLAEANGRLCLRLYRRHDGTILTRDCPVGLRGVRRRLSLSAGAIFAAIVTCAGIVFGQKQPKKLDDLSNETWKVTRQPVTNNRVNSISGEVRDTLGAVVPGARIVLKGENGNLKTVVNNDGIFEFPKVEPGDYLLTVEFEGPFEPQSSQLTVHPSETVNVVAVLKAMECTVTTGLSAVSFERPMIDTSVPSGTTVLKGDMLRKLPF